MIYGRKIFSTLDYYNPQSSRNSLQQSYTKGTPQAPFSPANNRTRAQCGGEYDQALDHAETLWPVLDSFTLYCCRRRVLCQQPKQAF